MFTLLAAADAATGLGAVQQRHLPESNPFAEVYGSANQLRIQALLRPDGNIARGFLRNTP